MGFSENSDIMLSFIFLKLLLLFLEVAVAATTNSSSFPLTLSSNNTFASPNLRIPEGSTYICDPQGYPAASFESCETAANQVQGTRDRLKFAQRQSGVDGIAIPHNWISSMLLFLFLAFVTCQYVNVYIDDQKCIVTLTLRETEETGLTSGRVLRDTVYALLDRCVKSDRRGGIVQDFGRSLCHVTIVCLE